MKMAHKCTKAYGSDLAQMHGLDVPRSRRKPSLKASSYCFSIAAFGISCLCHDNDNAEVVLAADGFPSCDRSDITSNAASALRVGNLLSFDVAISA